jgi:hypothetical protein
MATAVAAAVLISACSSTDNTPTRYATKPTPSTSAAASTVAGQSPTQAPASGNTATGGTESPPLGDGLQASMAGLTFTPSTTSLNAAGPATFGFRIIGTDGKAFTTFHAEQTQLMHLYLIRADLTGFQHLHPTMASDGTWTASLQPLQPGVYRAYVAFVAVAGSGDTASLLLGDKITVAGTSSPIALPGPASTTQVDGYTVTVSGPSLTAGTGGNLNFTITKAGAPVTDLQPYMGASGQLTGFHDGDLALTYPLAQGDAKGGPSLTFAAKPTESGNWRLFLQFQTAGSVHIAAITAAVR